MSVQPKILTGGDSD